MKNLQSRRFWIDSDLFGNFFVCSVGFCDREPYGVGARSGIGVRRRGGGAGVAVAEIPEVGLDGLGT